MIAHPLKKHVLEIVKSAPVVSIRYAAVSPWLHTRGHCREDDHVLQLAGCDDVFEHVLGGVIEYTAHKEHGFLMRGSTTLKRVRQTSCTTFFWTQ